MYVDVCVFTYSRLDLGAGWHERMSLLHDTAGEVADASLLLSVIGVLYLQTDDKVIDNKECECCTWIQNVLITSNIDTQG